MKNNKSPGNVSITDEIVLNVFVNVRLSSYILCLAKYLIVVVIQNVGMKVWFFSIYKSELKEDSFNYRGITLSYCSGKFFNSILFQRLQDKIESKNICPTFNPDLGRWTHYILTLFSLIKKYLKEGRYICTCFVNLKKAYDSIRREGLSHKLE